MSRLRLRLRVCVRVCLFCWKGWLGGKDSNICPLQETCNLFKALQSQESGIYKYL